MDVSYQVPLHRVLQEILDYVVDVCHENNLRYVLVYGTALGAYRHKGFIPWDDDLDIGMPRKDYEKFLQIMSERSDSPFELQNESNEQRWYLSFSKVRKKDTVFIESYAETMYDRNGIYIDIFPLDYVKNNRSILFRTRHILIQYLKHIIKFHACTDLFRSKYSTVRFILDCGISFPGWLISERHLLSWLNALRAGTCTEQDAVFLAEYDQTMGGALLKKEIYFPPCKVSFEGKTYDAPGKIEAYLESQYGQDYMQLPPVEKRATHSPVRLEF